VVGYLLKGRRHFHCITVAGHRSIETASSSTRYLFATVCAACNAFFTTSGALLLVLVAAMLASLRM
jgi:hypothetical protein